MGGIKKTDGFVIRALDYGESHKILSVLSQDAGMISLIAKGARKTESRFGAALELLTLSELVYYDREGLKTLSQADIVEPFSALKLDYERLSTGLRCARWIYRLLGDGQEEEGAFTLFYALLMALSEGAHRSGGEEGELALYELAFKVKLLALLGFRPALARCAVCGREPGGGRFSTEQGGMICGSCSENVAVDSVPIQAGTARALHMALQLPFSKLQRLKMSAKAAALGEKLIDRFAAHHLRPLSRS